MFYQNLPIKILTSYILKVFIVRFVIVVFFASILVSLIDFAVSGSINSFSFLLNLSRIFTFAFFVSSAWAIVSMQKTREFIMLQVCTISPFKIIGIFFLFNLLFSLFYIFVYDEILMQKFYPKTNTKNLYLSKFSVYVGGSKNDYEILSINKVNFNDEKKIFHFTSGDFFSFENGKFMAHKTLEKDTITADNDFIFIPKNKIQLKYNFDTLSKYFKEMTQKESFQPFLSKVKLALEFEKSKLENRKIKLEIFEQIQIIISFFYMTFISFLFFSHIPPRSPILSRFFFAICFLATVYIINMILMGWVRQFSVLNPALILTPSVIIFLTMIGFFTLKKT